MQDRIEPDAHEVAVEPAKAPAPSWSASIEENESGSGDLLVESPDGPESRVPPVQERDRQHTSSNCSDPPTTLYDVHRNVQDPTWEAPPIQSTPDETSPTPNYRGTASNFSDQQSPRLDDVSHTSTSSGLRSLHSVNVSSFRSPADVTLLQIYLAEPGPWVEALDSERHFTVKEIHHMTACRPWRAAALALASRYKEVTDPTYPPRLSLELYQDAVKKLIKYQFHDDDSGALAAVVLLFVYEMMTVAYDDWWRHLQGCAGIFLSHGWNGSTGGLVSSSFWAYVRSDIWAAFCRQAVTLIPPEKWFESDEGPLTTSDLQPDKHSHVILWLLAQVVNFLALRDTLDKANRESEWQSLWDDLGRWSELGGSMTRPIVDVVQLDAGAAETKTLSNPFPTIMYSSHSSIIAWTMYHTALVLLLEVSHPQMSSIHPTGTQNLLYMHARRACGIIFSNPHSPCLVNSIQPIWICGRNLRTAAEKFVALDLLSTIQKKTGWKCGWRSKSLRKIWNIE